MMNRLFPALADPTDGPALQFPDGTVTYRELAALASDLGARVVGRSRIAVWATPTLAAATGITAGLLAGVPVVPVNPKAGERELAHIVANSAPELVLTAPGVELPAAIAGLPRIDVDVAARPDPQPLPAEPPADAPALVVYTSGTTGPPKGAVLSRGAVAADLDALADAWAWTGADRLAHALPIFHVHGLVLGTLGPLRRGGSLHHLGAIDGQTLAAAVADGATMVFGVPTHYHRLAADFEADPEAGRTVGGTRLLISGSAALTAVDHARIEKATGIAVRERYGLTETLILTAARADEEPEVGTVGRPLANTEVRLAPLPAVEGEQPDGADSGLGAVEVRGPQLFSGYLDLPEASAASRTDDGWFRTGDIGRWTDSGLLALVGRQATDLIKSGGYKIGAGEIENALLEHPAVAEVAVVGVPDPDLGEKIVAHVVPAGEAPEARELVDHVAALLSPHKRPREVRFVESLPRNAMGKVQKKLL
ncbi:AMP-binding protein [Pseudonocardia kujensis]|uniref:AMP-binding protein n=1 Tax=Pseudonocardia kujensis TaxID=1128675 RepID=UPI001E3C04C7|nr:AMP-binding protein [Pseudonocardia kujensis]MCE0763403.1 AMP-binding protein [Pseudonocardia kujensis]